MKRYRIQKGVDGLWWFWIIEDGRRQKFPAVFASWESAWKHAGRLNDYWVGQP